MEFLSIIGAIGTIVSIILGVTTLCGVFFNKARTNRRIAEAAKKANEELVLSQQETDKCLLRHNITDLYYRIKYRCRNDENVTIYQHELEDILHMYKQYEALSGNSYVKQIVTEVKTWKVVE